jgi:hypothetical protein
VTQRTALRDYSPRSGAALRDRSYFDDAKAEKWFDAVLMLAHRHPRAIRAMEYAEHCEEIWGLRLPDPYPSFEEWRMQADSYVEPPSALPRALDS